MTDKICTIAALIVMMASLFFCGACLNRARTSEARLLEIKCSIQKELKETEEKCQRYSDACIHILSERVWEEGDARD